MVDLTEQCLALWQLKLTVVEIEVDHIIIQVLHCQPIFMQKLQKRRLDFDLHIELALITIHFTHVRILEMVSLVKEVDNSSDDIDFVDVFFARKVDLEQTSLVYLFVQIDLTFGHF